MVDMPTLYMMRGLPASGKSTKRKEMLADSALQPIFAINKDEIRLAMGIAPGNFDNEKAVLETETELIIGVLNAQANLIIDNTHNSPKYATRYEKLAAKHGYEFKLIDLSDVPLEECIRRDALRTGLEHVGEAIIRRMHNDFYNPTKKVQKPHVNGRKDEAAKPVPLVQDPTLPIALIVDLDGTLFEKTDRGWYEYSKAFSDRVVTPVHAAIWALVETGAVEHLIFLTGREESGREAAMKCLDLKAKFPVDGVTNLLLMKATGDHRPDTVAKLELFDANVRNKYCVLAVFEDRTRVVKMWRDLGLTVFQVAQTD